MKKNVHARHAAVRMGATALTLAMLLGPAAETQVIPSRQRKTILKQKAAMTRPTAFPQSQRKRYLRTANSIRMNTTRMLCFASAWFPPKVTMESTDTST